MKFNKLITQLITKFIIIIINFFINIIWLIVIFSIIFSWLYSGNILNLNNIIISNICYILFKLTEPMYVLIRLFIPILYNIDFSPLFVLVILYFLWYILNLKFVKIYLY